MKSYNELLYDVVNSGNFVRSFYGVCPECRRRIWSVGEKHNEGLSIQALFKCSCGKKYKETVYKKGMGTYKYPQAIAKDIPTKKYGIVRGFELAYATYIVLPEKVLKKEVK